MVKYTINNPIPVNFTDNKFSIYSADRLLYSINTLDFNIFCKNTLQNKISDDNNIRKFLLNPMHMSKKTIRMQIKWIKTKKEYEWLFNDNPYDFNINDIIQINNIYFSKIKNNKYKLDKKKFGFMPKRYLTCIILKFHYKNKKFIGYTVLSIDLKKKIRLYIPSEYTSFIKKIGYVSNNNKLLLT